MINEEISHHFEDERNKVIQEKDRLVKAEVDSISNIFNSLQGSTSLLKVSDYIYQRRSGKSHDECTFNDDKILTISGLVKFNRISVKQLITMFYYYQNSREKLWRNRNGSEYSTNYIYTAKCIDDIVEQVILPKLNLKCTPGYFLYDKREKEVYTADESYLEYISCKCSLMNLPLLIKYSYLYFKREK